MTLWGPNTLEMLCSLPGECLLHAQHRELTVLNLLIHFQGPPALSPVTMMLASLVSHRLRPTHATPLLLRLSTGSQYLQTGSATVAGWAPSHPPQLHFRLQQWGNSLQCGFSPKPPSTMITFNPQPSFPLPLLALSQGFKYPELVEWLFLLSGSALPEIFLSRRLSLGHPRPNTPCLFRHRSCARCYKGQCLGLHPHEATALCTNGFCRYIKK